MEHNSLESLDPPQSTFLDALPDDAILNVLRHLSEKPRKSDWPTYVNPGDALNSLHPLNPLSSVSRRTLTTLDSGNLGYGVRTGSVRLTNESSHCLLPEWMMMAPESVTSLTVGLYNSDLNLHAKIDDTPWLGALASRGFSLTHLYLCWICEYPLAASLLRATDGRLRVLHASARDVRLIARHCSGLRELKLLHDESHCLKKWGRELWETVGPTLESIEVRNVWLLCAPLLPEMQRLCRKLSKIMLRVPADAYPAYAALLCSYGPQLEFADLGVMHPELCFRVLSACPNVRFEIGFVWGEVSCNRTFAIGKHLVSHPGDVSLESLAAVADTCSRLESVCLSVRPGDAASVVRRFFGADKTLMKLLEIDVASRGFIKEALMLAGNGVRTLRTFKFRGGRQEMDAFRYIATQNRFLEAVEIWLTFPESNIEAFVVNVMENFLVCPVLCELTIGQTGVLGQERWQCVETFCSRLRYESNRKMCIHVLGIDYVT